MKIEEGKDVPCTEDFFNTPPPPKKKRKIRSAKKPAFY